MPVTTRQLIRLVGLIEQRFDLTAQDKEELLSILDDPAEAYEALEAGRFDWLFPRVTVTVSSSDGGRQWRLQVGPHGQIEAVLDNIHLDDLVDLFRRFLDKAQAGDTGLVDAKYLISGTNTRGQLVSIVMFFRENQTARVATTYLGHPRKSEKGGRIRV